MTRSEVQKILDAARQLDPGYALFGAKKHQYRLRPPLAPALIHKIEARHGLELPEDYVYFLTEIGDGGAGPDYGIDSFAEQFRETGQKWLPRYWAALGQPFEPRPMEPEEVEEYSIVTREGYEKDPLRYFIQEIPEEEDWSRGLLTLGTHGCQWDFALVLTGPHRGRVFDTDNEGGYSLAAESFTAYYEAWLARISDPQYVKRQVEFWQNLGRERKKGDVQ